MNMRDRVNKAYKGTSSTDNEAAGARLPEKKEAQGLRPAGLTKKTAPKPREPESPALAAAEGRAETLLKTGGPSGLAKAARFLLLLGTDEASKVLAHLSPKDIEEISREIIKVKSIDPVEASEILAEFGWMVRTKGYAIEGGAGTAESILKAAFGADRAKEVLRKAAPESQKPFGFLSAYEAKELQLILKDETAQVIAVILPYLDPRKASVLLERLPEEERIDIVKRIARLEKVSPEILRRVEEGLQIRIRRIGTVSSEEVDGKSALAGILRHVDPRLEAQVLEALDDENPELSRSVRERLFTIDDVLRVAPKDLQRALREFSDRDLALLLKGSPQDFRDKVLANVSASRKRLILDEAEILGAVRREDADEAAREFLTWLKAAWEEGDLRLDGDDDLVL